MLCRQSSQNFTLILAIVLNKHQVSQNVRLLLGVPGWPCQQAACLPSGGGDQEIEISRELYEYLKINATL